ncbi:MAG: hypothetical protein RR803_01200 [Malacoplasma sp.]
MNLKDLKIDCINKRIPIIHDDSIIYIAKLIRDYKLSNMLEIGSGLGYSAYFIRTNTKIKDIVSIEKNIDNFNFIIDNLKNLSIDFINDDAFIYEPKNKFDLIFIDGPKNKQEILFEKYSHFLNNKGIIIIDNILMNNLKLKTPSKRILGLINKNEHFKKFLLSQKEWNISFLNIGDGLAICTKK